MHILNQQARGRHLTPEGLRDLMGERAMNATILLGCTPGSGTLGCVHRLSRWPIAEHEDPPLVIG